MSSTQQVEYSAKVRMWLEAGDCCVSVSRVGESSLALADSVSDLPFDLPLLAYLITFVDDEEEEFAVTTRRRLGGVIYFDRCEHKSGAVQAPDCVPF